MNATMTNAMTDVILSLFLLYVCITSLIYRVRGDKRFTRYIVVFFFTTFAITFLGALVHYLTDRVSEHLLQRIWLVISTGVVFLNYSVIYAIRVPESIRMLVMIISLLFLYLFTISEQFIFIALSMIFVYILAAVYSRKLTRVGFLAVVVSNIIWVVVRQGINYELGYPLPAQYRYDNDVYHFLILFSIYIIYKSIKENDWSYPEPRH